MENDKPRRITREDMYFEFVNSISKRSTCSRHKVGAVLVRDKRVVAMGYNGVLPGIHPTLGIDPETGKSRTVHAEANIIAFCAKHGIETERCTMYVSISPCVKCAELIAQAGIVSVYYREEYRDPAGIKILDNQGILCQVYTK